jgi:hypothetical protein
VACSLSVAFAFVSASSCNHADSRKTKPNNGVSVTVTTPAKSAPTTAATTNIPSSATPSTSAPGRSKIRLTLGPDNANFDASVSAQLTGVIENSDPAPVEVDMCVLGSAILSLEFHNAAGERMFTIPPGMPPTVEQQKKCQATLAPGAKRTVTYGIHIFSPELPKGTYTARASGLSSNTVTFTITGP